MPTCLVSLGANLGRTRIALDEAIDRLGSHPGIRKLRESTRLETPAMGGPPGQPPFLNSVARVETSIDPWELLQALQATENQARRARGVRWAARTLDLDLIAYGEKVIRRHGLRVPHPRMSFRPFVLEPAAEIAPDWRHPELRSDLSRLLRVCRKGAPTLRVLGDEAEGRLSGAEVAPLVRLELPDKVACEVGRVLDVPPARVEETPRLTIDVSGCPTPPLGPSGPRLALNDCPPEHWRDEVRAAIRCVWPSASRVVS